MSPKCFSLVDIKTATQEFCDVNILVNKPLSELQCGFASFHPHKLTASAFEFHGMDAIGNDASLENRA